MEEEEVEEVEVAERMLTLRDSSLNFLGCSYIL